MVVALLSYPINRKERLNPVYSSELNTLRDHLRKVRLDLGLSQPDVAKIVNVTGATITGWELNRNQPTAKFANAVIDFLGQGKTREKIEDYIMAPYQDFKIDHT